MYCKNCIKTVLVTLFLAYFMTAIIPEKCLKWLAAELGLEPRQYDSESYVLPLHNSAISMNKSLVNKIILPNKTQFEV